MESSEVAITPQALFLTFLGVHVLSKPVAVSGASIVEVFGWLGVAPAATRSLLSRNTERKMLSRHKAGRKTYYSLTRHGSAILEDGRGRVWQRCRDTEWDGQWTTVAVSIPEDVRHLRHRARSRLGWAGFGNTGSGLWVAPGRHDVQELLGPGFDGIDLTVLIGRTEPPTTDRTLVSSAYDLDGIARHYVDFESRWARLDVSNLAGAEAFAARIRLHAQWLSLGRVDPLLPPRLLPTEWPAARADRSFRRVDAALVDVESAEVGGYLDSLTIEPDRSVSD
ncbi:hypothetical protein CH254_24115 [Rhodococcus sp. 06-412-2C]|uniref:PaaX family transcriptional regulator n=1 Tax=unclassified Rhodococcus (in: high G+C Gram-positive bacteria) TaxID=192944 RepID=UPI000B9C2EDC|nr:MULTISPECIES: PaaX family transcriptional regulator C-terminal domain-containing protein [unclassified Rhodococcus (in: high G+C Gram-positive bacteria)]OZC83972.1 hypothetical protein CH254_24115 [Rhodococcus sp. 06-412-2C]OZC94159.1 hypothetical protein CH279_22200 [Rhodococcus sp. 06-412-2B]